MVVPRSRSPTCASRLRARAGHRCAFFDQNPVGRVVTRLTTDVDVLNEMFAAGAITLVMDVLTRSGIVGFMLWIDWRLALVTPSAPVMVSASSSFGARRAATTG